MRMTLKYVSRIWLALCVILASIVVPGLTEKGNTEQNSDSHSELSTAAHYDITGNTSCLDSGFEITHLCNISQSKTELLGALATFEDLSQVLFVSDVVTDLVGTCDNRTWCLEEGSQQQLLAELGESYLAFCDLAHCLLQLPDECLTDERRLVLSTLLLLCRASDEAVTGVCMLAIRQMSHVAMADLYREIDGEDLQDGGSCSAASREDCSGECYELGWQLHCLSELCEDKVDMLMEFNDWQWFYTIEDAMDNCGIEPNTTQCSDFIQPDVFVIDVGDSFLESILDGLGVGVLTGIITATIITMLGFGILTLVCARRLRRKYYMKGHMGYQEVQSTEPLIPDELSADEIEISTS